ncbi:MAG: redoxin domain-containing protein [Acidobacteriota bacterium]
MTGRGDPCGRKQSRDGRCCGKAREGFSKAPVAACLALLLLAAARPAFSASPSVDEILRKTGSVYSHLQDYHIAAVHEEATTLARGMYSHRFAVTLDVAGQGRVRMAVTGGNPEVLIVSDGTTTWHYAPGRNEYTEREAGALLKAVGTRGQRAGQKDLLGQMQGLLVGRFEKLWRLDKEATVKGKSKVKLQGRKVSCYRVELRFKSFTDNLWIDRSNFLVLREKLERHQKTGAAASFVTDTLQVKDVDLQPERSPGFFTFTPPAGARRVPLLGLPGLRESPVGSPAGDFTLPDTRGKQISLSEFRGKTVVLSFWATWCPPCKMELPTIQTIYEQGKGKNVVVLAVDDEDKATVRDFLKQKHYDFTALIDSKRTLFKRFAIHYIPTVFVINDQGIIVRRIEGWQGPQDLLAAVKASER